MSYPTLFLYGNMQMSMTEEANYSSVKNANHRESTESIVEKIQRSGMVIPPRFPYCRLFFFLKLAVRACEYIRLHTVAVPLQTAHTQKWVTTCLES